METKRLLSRNLLSLQLLLEGSSFWLLLLALVVIRCNRAGFLNGMRNRTVAPCLFVVCSFVPSVDSFASVDSFVWLILFLRCGTGRNRHGVSLHFLAARYTARLDCDAWYCVPLRPPVFSLGSVWFHGQPGYFQQRGDRYTILDIKTVAKIINTTKVVQARQGSPFTFYI